MRVVVFTHEGKNPVSVLHFPATTDVLLLYPGDSLTDQIDLWALQHPDWQTGRSFERSLPEIRKLLHRASAALVDATADPSQATDAFLQAVARLGPGAVAMYTEAAHEGLEVFVRMRGSLFLLGPLFGEQWEDFFQQLLGVESRLPPSNSQGKRPSPLLPLLDRNQWRQASFMDRFGTGFGWPVIDFKDIDWRKAVQQRQNRRAI